VDILSLWSRGPGLERKLLVRLGLLALWVGPLRLGLLGVRKSLSPQLEPTRPSMGSLLGWVGALLEARRPRVPGPGLEVLPPPRILRSVVGMDRVSGPVASPVGLQPRVVVLQ
jgi:hypothetical protein